MEHIWDDWSDSEDELIPERRQYKMNERIDMSKWDDADFIYRFRVSKESVAHILQIISPCLQHSHERCRYIRPITQLLIALRFYALGSFQVAIGDFAGVSISSVCRIIKKVSSAIVQHRQLFIRMPSTNDELMKASREFYQFARFPRTIGAIDCTHVKIQSPGGIHAENYRNRKGFFSYNVQAVCSADMKIINIVARWPGASHDQTIFNNSNLKMKMERGDFGKYILVGDSGYANTRYLATPLLNCQNDAEQLYNESQIRTRNPIERTFGVWKRRFPVLSMGMRLELPTVRKVIVACAVLHNIAIESKDSLPPNRIEGLEAALDAGHIDENMNAAAQERMHNNVRDNELLPYFHRVLAQNPETRNNE